MKQELGEQKGGQVIESEGPLQAVGCDVTSGPEATDVVDQHVESREPGENVCGQPPDLGLL
jgi:hypothetical protein